MDKYEEAARAFALIDGRNHWEKTPGWVISRLAELFRWYEERWEKVCEYKRVPAPVKFAHTKCGHSIELPNMDSFEFCPYCGRRIVEKEGEVK